MYLPQTIMRQFVEYTIFSAKGATGTGLAIPCKDFRHVIFSLATNGVNASPGLTVKFQGAISPVSNASPSFGSSRSVANMWDYIEVIDLQNGSAIDGDTGIPVVTSDDFRLAEANINGLAYICATITAWAVGSITIKCLLFND